MVDVAGDVADVARPIKTRGRSASCEETIVLGDEGPARCITARRGRDGASSDQTFVLGALPIQDAQRPRLRAQHGLGVGEVGDPMYTLTTRGDHAVFAFDYQQLTHPQNRSTADPAGPAPTIARGSRMSVAAAGSLRPRRLTPVEVERCFGFADGYTDVAGGSDTSRYMALGNSIAVPVIRWIGQRLITVDNIINGAR